MLWAWLGECGQGGGGLGMSWGWELLYLPREGDRGACLGDADLVTGSPWTLTLLVTEAHWPPSQFR